MVGSQSKGSENVLRAAADLGLHGQLQLMLKQAQSKLVESEEKLVASENQLDMAYTRIEELESQRMTPDTDCSFDSLLQEQTSTTFWQAHQHGLIGAKHTFEDEDRTIVLVGGHHIGTSACVFTNRFTARTDVLMVERKVRVQVFVCTESMESSKPSFTVYWQHSKTIGDLRREMKKMLPKQVSDFETTWKLLTADVVIADAHGRILCDEDSLVCTITKSGTCDDEGWVLCQLQVKSAINRAENLNLGWKDEIEHALRCAGEKLPCCDIGDEEAQSEDEEGYEDESSEEEGGEGATEKTDTPSKVTSRSAKDLEKVYASAEHKAVGQGMLPEATDESPFFFFIEGPAGTKTPTFRHFYPKLPSEDECKIPEKIPEEHSLHTLRDKFFGMGVLHQSAWRRLPSLFLSEISELITDLDPLDTTLPSKLEESLGAMINGVEILTQMVPFVPLEYKDRISELNDQLEVHRKQMVADCEDDENAEDIREELVETLSDFDTVFTDLVSKYNEARQRTEALSKVEEDGKIFDESLKRIQVLTTTAVEQLNAEREKKKRAQQTKQHAEDFQAQVEAQTIRSLDMNLLAQRAAKNERDRLNEEIRRLELRRDQASALLKRHRNRRTQILDVAGKNRLSYLQFCSRQAEVDSAVATRIRRAESEVNALNQSTSSLQRLKVQYEQSLVAAAAACTHDCLDTGVDAFAAYCGARKFHFVDHCNGRDALALEGEELKRLDKEKKRLETLARRLRTERAKEEAEAAACKFVEQQRVFNECEAKLEGLEHRRAEAFSTIDPILATLRKAGARPAPSEVGGAVALNALMEKVASLKYPTEWEAAYEEEAAQYLESIEEEMEHKYTSSRQRLIQNLQ